MRRAGKSIIMALPGPPWRGRQRI